MNINGDGELIHKLHFVLTCESSCAPGSEILNLATIPNLSFPRTLEKIEKLQK